MMRAGCSRCRDLIEEFLSSELLVETSQEVLSHCSNCPECRRELEVRQELRVQLKRALDTPPPPSLESKILATLAGGQSQHLFKARRSRRWSSAARQSAGFVGTALAAAAIFWLTTQYGQVSAAELLTDSTHAEREVLATTGFAWQQIVSVDERALPAGTLVSRRRVELWRDGRSGMTVRRAYDEEDQLVAGELIDRDRSGTVFMRGADPEPTSSGSTDARVAIALEAGQPWRMGLSAEEFVALMPEGVEARVRSVPDGYELLYEAGAESGHQEIRRASMTIRRSDFHPVRQVLEVRRAQGSFEYRWAEQDFRAVPEAQVAPAIFSTDTDLTALRPAAQPAALVPPVETKVPPAVLTTAPPNPRHRTNTIIDVLYRLHRIDTCLRGDITIDLTNVGRINAVVRVETELRRAEVVAALDDLAPEISVKVEVAKRADSPAAAADADLHAHGGSSAGGAGSIAYGAVRRYLESHNPAPPGSSVDEALARLSDRLLNRAQSATTHAQALAFMTSTFPTQRPEGASLNLVATWQTMLRDHARAFVRETEALRLELQPIFCPALLLAPSEPARDGSTPNTLDTVVGELVARALGHEQSVRELFQASPEDAMAGIPGEAFCRSLLRSEALASEFERPWALDER